jgi:hypothetical protein
MPASRSTQSRRLPYRASFAVATREAWTADEREYVRRAGYCLVHLAAKDERDSIPDDELRTYLAMIGETIHASRWGGSCAPLDEALSATTAYATVDVLHGEQTNARAVDASHESTHPAP